MKYIVMEIQDNGATVGNQVFAFDSVNDAEAKYHSILAAAAVSQVPCHSCVMLNSEGMMVKEPGCYKHGE